MKTTAQFLLALLVAAFAVAAFRALAFTLYTVDGHNLEPELVEGDRILVNRWSYGLRTGGGKGLFYYGRLLASPVEKGDIVAFDSPDDGHKGVLVCRCMYVPGDTVAIGKGSYLVPGRAATCADEDYYWMEALGKGGLDSRSIGPVPESRIIGRVCMVVYSRDKSRPLLESFRSERTLLLK